MCHLEGGVMKWWGVRWRVGQQVVSAGGGGGCHVQMGRHVEVFSCRGRVSCKRGVIMKEGYHMEWGGNVD